MESVTASFVEIILCGYIIRPPMRLLYLSYRTALELNLR